MKSHQSKVILFIFIFCGIVLYPNIKRAQAKEVQNKKLFAVLNIENQGTERPSRLRKSKLEILTEIIREEVIDTHLFNVITKENIRVLLPPGKTLEECSDGSCEVDIGRKLGAHYIITGQVIRVDDELNLVLKLHSTENATLLHAKTIEARRFKGLRKKTRKVTKSMLSKLTRSEDQYISNDTLLYLDYQPFFASVKIGNRTFTVKQLKKYKVKTQGQRGYLIPIKAQKKQKLRIFAKGYMSHHEEILARKGKVVSITTELKPIIKQTNPCAKSRKKTMEACKARLVVRTNIVGASIYVNGKPHRDPNTGDITITEPGKSKGRNVGAIDITLPAGDYIIEARAEKYQSSHARVTLQAQEMKKNMQMLELIRNYGSLTITTTPRQASIEIDGAVVAQASPYNINEIEAGPHKIKIRAPNYKVFEKIIFIEKDEDYDEPFKLVPNYSNLKITIYEYDKKSKRQHGKVIEGAKLVLDRNFEKSKSTNDLGQIRWNGVVEGAHHIRASHPLYGSYSSKIPIRSGGEEQEISLTLQAKYAYISIIEKRGTAAKAYLLVDKKKQLLGQLPLMQIPIPMGTQKIKIEPDQPNRYHEITKKIALNIKERKLVSVKLKKRIGMVFINAKPLGSRVFIDGKDIGESPIKAKLLQGSHRLEIKAEGHDPYYQTFEVIEEKTIELEPRLGNLPQLEIHCRPKSSTVWAQGVALGKSPQIHQATEGRWDIACQLGDAWVSEYVDTYKGMNERKYLKISKTEIAKIRQKGKFWNVLGWSLIGVGVSSMGVGAGLWFGPVSTRNNDRETAYQQYVLSDEQNFNARRQQLLTVEEDLLFYQDMSLWTLGSGLLLTGIGSLMVILAPSVKAKAAKKKRNRKRRRKRRKKSKLLQNLGEKLDQMSYE